MTRVTPEIADRIATMRERGCTKQQIAKACGVSVGAVEWHCLSRGIEPPNPRPLPPVPTQPVVHIRNGRPVRRFTAEEDAKILAMRQAGARPSEIARALPGRKPHSVLGRLHTLARHQERAEA